jgi:hypothetical protein
MTYNHEEICAKLEGVQGFAPPQNLMGKQGEPVIAKICAANNINVQEQAPVVAAAPTAPQTDWKNVLG